ncbi:hypothetical protein [Marinomonas mediterranea]|jgi:hypothetical protein|uniref:VanZ family protein n=1 Tax=Marinomonas mediterranea (strain ATCC 700492 / JCM 21426 / NBRC 103028 / MMB-1) TaxID=717774 RepID=F2JZX9_MARM1|nr:hypothetical protein [Marinomonas mediterranea]ADZ92091.1 hypothetical protein Marme_2869 [Marinomonas mediterranea MMB-1]WCN10053.1 hypothetical protein GV055_14590 [Marinomonas mediterranea]WCN14103.1 hypothetical protein GV054_14415 [Marinomonas mediterranea]WCN18159.1 hypothetical protein GV053_14505 [Marinomonas mediterranea MMB-1]
MKESVFQFLKSPKAQRVGFWIGFLIISFATLLPADELPPVPGGDKLHHIVGFGGWALLCCLGPIKRFYRFSVLIILWGGAIELIQPYVNRYGEWLDFFADAAGVVIVLFATLLLKTLKKYKERMA